MKKIKNYIPRQLCAAALVGLAWLSGCTSPEERGARQIDTVTNAGSMSGSNGVIRFPDT